MPEKPPGSIVALVDIGRVLARLDVARAFEGLAARTGCTPEAAEAALFSRGLKHDFDLGLLNGTEFARAVLDAVGAESEADAPWFEEVWCSVLLGDHPDAGAFLAALRAAGCRIALASNTDPIHYQHLRAHSVAVRSVNEACLSYHLRARKPDPAFYLGALAQLGVAAQACVFFDDREANVGAAATLGIRGAVFPSSDVGRWIAEELPELLDSPRTPGP